MFIFLGIKGLDKINKSEVSDMKERTEIKLPKVCFEGNYSDCLYANFYNKDSCGRVKCDGP